MTFQRPCNTLPAGPDRATRTARNGVWSGSPEPAKDMGVSRAAGLKNYPEEKEKTFII